MKMTSSRWGDDTFEDAACLFVSMNHSPLPGKLNRTKVGRSNSVVNWVVVPHALLSRW